MPIFIVFKYEEDFEGGQVLSCYTSIKEARKYIKWFIEQDSRIKKKWEGGEYEDHWRSGCDNLEIIEEDLWDSHSDFLKKKDK